MAVTAIKLETKKDNTYSRDTWFKFGPFSVTENKDDSITVSVKEHESQICTPKENEFGKYFLCTLFGGTCIVNFMDGKWGKYYRIKLGKEVKLPEEIVEVMNYKPKGGFTKTSTVKASEGAKPTKRWS